MKIFPENVDDLNSKIKVHTQNTNTRISFVTFIERVNFEMALEKNRSTQIKRRTILTSVNTRQFSQSSYKTFEKHKNGIEIGTECARKKNVEHHKSTVYDELTFEIER